MENMNSPLEENQSGDSSNNFKIYSKKAILGFSIFFSTIFGAVLLMTNLRGIGQEKQANIILLCSIIYTALTIFLVNLPENQNSALTYLCNMVGGFVLSEVVFKKNFPNDETIEKKKIWKPLIISILITVPFILALIYKYSIRFKYKFFQVYLIVKFHSKGGTKAFQYVRDGLLEMIKTEIIFGFQPAIFDLFPEPLNAIEMGTIAGQKEYI